MKFVPIKPVIPVSTNVFTSRLYLPLVAIFALSSLLVYHRSLPSYLYYLDGAVYADSAWHLLTTGHFRTLITSPFHLNFQSASPPWFPYVPPLHPLSLVPSLAFFGRQDLAAILPPIIFQITSITLLYIFIYKISGSAKKACVASFWYTLFPLSHLLPLSGMSEPLFAVLFLLFLIQLSSRKPQPLWCAVLFILMSLTRFHAVLVAIAFFALSYFYPRFRRLSLVCLIASIAAHLLLNRFILGNINSQYLWQMIAEDSLDFTHSIVAQPHVYTPLELLNHSPQLLLKLATNLAYLSRYFLALPIFILSFFTNAQSWPKSFFLISLGICGFFASLTLSDPRYLFFLFPLLAYLAVQARPSDILFCLVTISLLILPDNISPLLRLVSPAPQTPLVSSITSILHPLPPKSTIVSNVAPYVSWYTSRPSIFLPPTPADLPSSAYVLIADYLLYSPVSTSWSQPGGQYKLISQVNSSDATGLYSLRLYSHK